MTHESSRFTGRALRDLWVAAVILVGIPALVPAVSRPPAAGVAPANARAARAERPRSAAARAREAAGTVDRLRARFRETLDFAPLMDEFLVADAGRRNARAGGFHELLAAAGADAAILDSLDDADLNRAYAGYLTLVHLGIGSALAGEAPEADDVRPPPEAEREMLASAWFRAVLAEDDRRAPPIETRDDLLRWTADAERISAEYRRAATSGRVESPAVLAHREGAGLDAGETLATRSDAASGYAAFGVPDGATVYEVSRDGVLWYDVVEERGTLRVLSVDAGE